ncbi:MAG: ABC transporter substrate binding protein, partial [Syntrophales bacterium]|nr:ABC transporter substrate binding protein [Syntrophales bacterium]
MQPKKILLIHSFEPLLPYSAIVNQSILSTLRAGLTVPVEFYSEYLDLARFPDKSCIKGLRDLFYQKYGRHPVDLVIVFLDPALGFVQEHGQGIFDDIPIVFLTVEKYQIARRTLNSNTTGVLMQIDPQGTLDAALKLQPDIEQVVVISGTHNNDRAYEKTVREEFSKYAGKIKFSYINNLPLEEILTRVQNLPARTILFFVTMFQDGAGAAQIPAIVVSKISKAANVPVYGLFETYMGHGIIGGHLVSFERQGEKAAEIGLRILNGEKPANIPIVNGPNNYSFDWRELKRWGIPEVALPTDSIIRYKVPTTWELYKWQVIGIVSFCLIESSLIFILIVQYSRRKKVEDTLRKARRHLDEIIEHLPDPTFVIDADGKVIAWNRAIEQMSGVPKKEMIGKGNYEYARPFYGEQRPIIIDLAFLSDEEFEKRNYDAIHRSADTLYGEVYVPNTYGGKGAYLSATASRLRDTAGNVTGAIESIRDITERKLAEEALQTNEARLKAIFDSVQDLIFIKDANHRYLVINNYFQKRFQVDPSIFLGHTDAEIPIYENKDMTGAIILGTDALVLQGETVHSELTHRVFGTLITFDILKTPVRDAQGNVTGICGVCRDITERRRIEDENRSLEERLNRAEKMEALGTLAGGVAHDLNNVLGVVIGYAELLLSNVSESDPTRPHLVNVMKGGERAAAIVQDLLTLARRGVSTRQVLNLNKIISDCQQSPEFEKLYSYHSKIKFKTDFEPDLLNISGSSIHLGKSLYNLVSNASEAMTKGGIVTIQTTNQYLDK